MLFFRKSEVEKRAERGDKSAILELLRKGDRKKARKLLEEHRDDPDLRKVLFDLYVDEEYYMQALQLLEEFGPELGSARKRALVYDRSGDYERAVEEYLKVGDFESLYRASELLYMLGRREEALSTLRRAEKLAPSIKKEELQKRILKGER